ncbi:MAG TPA: glycosyltransferase family 4 protein [Solirubrobacteraceae bacterium]|jgi:glycosyltransferase involved in cell wall biosynthesis|nr:glycosyltransferase family 4 protein [Solirubrobacteraceae bacterium]
MPRERPTVVYWNHSPTPYFVDRFNAIAERGAFRFEAWFNERRQSIRSWEVDESTWRFRARYIPERTVLGRSLAIPVPELLEVRPELLVQEYDRAHLTAGFAAAKLLAGRTAFRVLPNFDAWSDRTWWRELGKQVVFRAVDGAKVPGDEGARLAVRYGLDVERASRVTQSIDYPHWFLGSQIPDLERTRVRAELGLAGCVFIFVGRLWSKKGTAELMDAYAAISLGRDDVSLLLVGDGPDEGELRARAKSLPRVHFAGFAQTAELPALYAISDAMVFPTHGDPHGLVVEEAMACGLPVICSSAAGDIRQRLPNGTAGLIVPAHDSRSLGAAMQTLASSERRRREMGATARAIAAGRDVPRYAEDFESFAFRILGLPRRRSLAAVAVRAAGAMLVHGVRGETAIPLVSESGASESDDQTL